MLSPSLVASLWDSWAFFVHLAVTLVPLFVGGSFLVGLTQEYLPPERIEALLRGHDEGAGNVAAAGLGAVTPFCSCSTVPVLAGLLQAGAPLGLAFSFLLASPLVNELAVLLLIGVVGVEATLYYVAVTLLSAVVGGVVIGRLGLADDVKDVRLAGGAASGVATDGGTANCCTGSTTDRSTSSADCCTSSMDCGTDTPEPKTHGQRLRTAASDAWSFFRETLPYLLLGITLGALIHGLVPVAVLQTVLGPENPLAVPLAALAGAPVYVSMSGMLPVAASLSEQGIPFGTVLAFVVGGAGVSIPNLVLLNKLFERRLLLVYAGTVVAIGVLLGTLFNAFVV